MSTNDILMITYNRAEYTRLALRRLLETCDERATVWVWQNGSDMETLRVVESFRQHPRLGRFHHSVENKRLNEPTNWLWAESKADYLTKVDDDCLMPMGWLQTLRAAHAANPKFGVLGCWRFPDEDFVPRWANRKIKEFEDGHRLMCSLWIEGSGYMMKRQCVLDQGLLGPKDNFPNYVYRLAERGYIHGWYFPFLYQEHMDDPRSPHTVLKTDQDLLQSLPLSAQARGDVSLKQWQKALQQSARRAQYMSADLRDYSGWRNVMRRYVNKVRNRLGLEVFW